MKIRVGKNIYFTLTVLRLDNTPEDFTDARNIRLVINRKFSSYQFEPRLTIVDNVISFEFPASPQATTGEYEMHLSYEKLNDESVTGKDTYYLDCCKAFMLVDSTCKEDGDFSTDVPTVSLKGVIDRNRDGKDGVTPRIDPETKHWLIGFEDTGIVAEGKDGLTPYIGENGNWFIGDVDTGKPSRGKAFEYSDFTPEEIYELQEPARDMIESLDALDEAVTKNEQQRIENETARVSSENTRKESENLRREAEQTRDSNEKTREAAESNRETAEEGRETAELTRVESEKGRVSAESTRVENENARKLEEGKRDSAEKSRVDAETKRVTAEEARVTEFNRLKSESETATQNATTQANYAKEQGDNVAGTVEEIKTAQTGLVTRLNNYITDVSGLFGKLAVRSDKFTDEKQVTSGKYYDLNGNLVDSISGGYGYQKLDIDNSKVYYLDVLFTGGNISTLMLFDANGNIIKNYSRVAVKGYHVFEGVASIGISFDMNNQAKYSIQSYDIQDINTVLNTQQGNRALYVAAGAKYNEETGFYELNGLTDITEEQMKLIYVESNPSKRMTDLCAIFNTSQIRTNFPFRVTGGYKQVDCHATFVNCDKLEVAALGISMGTVFYANRVHYMFQNCKKLHTVIGILRMDYSSEYTNMFSNCLALENVSLRGVKSDLSLVSSPLISLASLKFLITSNSNTSPITITVHADVFAKINDETNTEWHALLAAAEAKQITFATA